MRATRLKLDFWQGIPLKLYPATSSGTPIPLHFVCSEGHRINYIKKCMVCNKELQYEELHKGYVNEDGTVTILDKEKLKQLQEHDKVIQRIGLIPQDTIQIPLIERTYYVLPDEKDKFHRNTKQKFCLLRDGLAKTGMAMVVKFAIRTRSHLGILWTYKEHLVLTQIAYPERINKVNPIEADYPNELLEAFVQKLEQMKATPKKEQLNDTYVEEVTQLILQSKGYKPPKPSESKEKQKKDLIAELEDDLKVSVK